MKKVLLPLFVLGFVLVFTACETKLKESKECPSLGDAEKVEGLISKDEAQEMLDLYIDNQYAIINEKRQTEDNLDIYFSLDKLKNYIAYLDEQSKTAENPITGVRIYFGAKDSENGRSTVFFYPTYTQESSESKAAIISTQESESEIKNSTEAQGMDYGLAGKPPKKNI